MQELEANVTAAQVSDALDLLGRRSQAMDGAITPLSPGSRAVGRAVTVRFAPVDHDVDEPYDAAIEFIDSLPAGAMAVIATGVSTRSGFWGELFSAAAIGRGAAGVVCDGYVRDSAKLRAMGFAVFAAGLRPVDFRARMEITGSGRPVVCGGVLVNPGDLIVADDDGVVVVPADVEVRAVELANDKASRETIVLDALRGGATLRSVWDSHRVL